MGKRRPDPEFLAIAREVAERYPETMRYLAEVERLEREEGLSEREAAARARPRTA